MATAPRSNGRMWPRSRHSHRITGQAQRVEIISAKEPRRRWSDPRRCLEELYFLGHQQAAKLRGEAFDEILVRKHGCGLFNAKVRTGLCLGALSWLSPFPTIPQWKCPIVPRPSKITLSNATSPTSIEKGGSPVRGLWSEPRPFVVTFKLSMPTICYDRRSPIFHLAVSSAFCPRPFGFVFSANDP